MAINVTKTRMPVNFELSEDSDSRFKKVKIWIAHTGENLNNSYFSKETLETMSKTLSNIPIVGYIERNEENDDFKGHESEITIKDNDIDVRYNGHAYGFIPEDCNQSFELRDGKEWLTAQGYLWTKFKDAIKIFDEANGYKNQSMEIAEVEGEVDELGRLVINFGVFSALCILGDDVAPAMTGSSVEYYSKDKNNYKRELEEMLTEFAAEKGESGLPENETNEVETIVEPEVKPEIEEITTEQEVEPEIEGNITNEEGFSEEEPAQEVELETQVEPEPEIEPEQPIEEPQPEAVAEFTTIEFQLSHDNIRTKLYEAMGNQEDVYNYITEVYDDHFIVSQSVYGEEGHNDRFVRVAYSKNENGVELGETEEIFAMFLNEKEKNEVENSRTRLQEIEAELLELKEFKSEIEVITKEEIVSEYEDIIGEEAAKTIREQFSLMTVEEIEKEVAIHHFQKTKESRKEQHTILGVNNFQKKESKSEEGYGSLNQFFK